LYLYTGLGASTFIDIAEAVLIELLQSGHIGVAGIDVFDNEPIAANHAYLALDNVVMTPHVAYNTPEAVAAMYDTAIDNLVVLYAGKPQNVAANPEIWIREHRFSRSKILFAGHSM
jgi:phosphoglycerate dehydrogenase-like enzyme